MRDTLVLGTDHKMVRKKCIAEGNGLTFQKARDIAHTEEATQEQLIAMNLKPPAQQVDGSFHDHGRYICTNMTREKSLKKIQKNKV